MTTAADVLRIAEQELDYTESYIDGEGNYTKFGQWYGVNPGAWCAMFVSYCFYTADLPLLLQNDKGFCSCPEGAKRFKWQDKWIFSSPASPDVGDIIFFNWQGIQDDPDQSDHVGIVKEILSNGDIVTIEGNGGGAGTDKVAFHTYAANSPFINGYVHLPYDGISTTTSSSHPVWTGYFYTLTSPPTQANAIQVWQKQMIARGWILGTTGPSQKGDDGVFTQRSYDVLLQFQREKGLEVDGILGPNSWNAAWEALVTSSSSNPPGSKWQDFYNGLSLMGSEIPRKGLQNSNLASHSLTTEPYGDVISFNSVDFVKGKASWFGGPLDQDTSEDEQAALTQELLRSIQKDVYYCAMRWSYSPNSITFWKNRRLLVLNPTNQKAVIVRAIDWGPNPVTTDRMLDLSPQALQALGADTDDNLLCAFAKPNDTTVGPLSS
jgi:hypothetical protein